MDRPWTPDEAGADLVNRELIAAFREAQGRAIYSPRRCKLELVQGEHISGLDFIALTSTFLTRSSFDRLALLTYARCRATGASISEICREHGWKRDRFDDARKRAAKVVAIGMHGVATGQVLLV